MDVLGVVDDLIVAAILAILGVAVWCCRTQLQLAIYRCAPGAIGRVFEVSWHALIHCTTR